MIISKSKKGIFWPLTPWYVLCYHECIKPNEALYFWTCGTRIHACLLCRGKLPNVLVELFDRNRIMAWWYLRTKGKASYTLLPISWAPLTRAIDSSFLQSLERFTSTFCLIIYLSFVLGIPLVIFRYMFIPYSPTTDIVVMTNDQSCPVGYFLICAVHT